MSQTKELSVNCLFEGYQQQFSSLKESFLKLEHNQKYAVSVSMCNQIKQLFDFLFYQSKPNLVKFQLSFQSFLYSEFKLFTSLSWPSLLIVRICNDFCCESLSKCEMPQLSSLDFEECEISDIGISYIFSKTWQKLTSLNFERTRLSEQILSKIDKSKQPLLQKLSLTHCSVSGKSLFSLNQNIGWPNLEELRIGFLNITKLQVYDGLSNILQYPFNDLKKFHFFKTHLSKNSIKNFTKSKWDKLTQLVVCGCRLQHQSIQVLFKCKWKQLNLLSLNTNQINECSLDSLSDTDWHSLLSVQLNENKFTILGILNLAKLTIQKAIFESTDSLHSKTMTTLIDLA